MPELQMNELQMNELQMLSIDEIITKTLSKLIIFDGIPKLFVMLGWTSITQKIIGIILGLILKVITLIILHLSVLMTDYHIGLSFRLFALTILNILHIIITVGTVWSEEKLILELKKADLEFQNVEIDCKTAHENLQINQKQMHDMMNAMSRMNPNDDILQEIKKYKKEFYSLYG